MQFFVKQNKHSFHKKKNYFKKVKEKLAVAKDRKDHRSPNNAARTVLPPFPIFFSDNGSWWAFQPRQRHS